MDVVVRWTDRKQMRMAMLSNKLRSIYLYLSQNDDIRDELIWSPRDQIAFYLEHIKQIVDSVKGSSLEETRNIARCLTITPLKKAQSVIIDFLNNILLTPYQQSNTDQLHNQQLI